MLATAASFAIASCGGGTTVPAAARTLPTPTPAPRVVETTCTQAPIIEVGGLTVDATVSYANVDWTLRVGVAPFAGTRVYPVTLDRKPTLDVVLNSNATATDQSRVTALLQSAPGVANVGLAPQDPSTPPGVLPIELRVTVRSADDIDGVLPKLYQDPAVNPIFTATSFYVNSEPAAPADITLERDQSVPLHSVSGTVTPAADGDTGTFDIMVEYPFTGNRYNLVGHWACPVAPPSIGTAGTNLGAPTATATINASATSFSPATVTVRVGQIVEWTVPQGLVPYNVTFADHQDVSSGALAAGSTWEIRFTRPGTYHYTDTIHPGNNGTVIVTA
jgi:plastocyanin